MLVGTLDGGIHWWGTRESQPHPLIHQQGSIIHMQFNRERKVRGLEQDNGTEGREEGGWLGVM